MPDDGCWMRLRLRLRLRMRSLVFDEFLNGFVGDSHVSAEFLNGEELVRRFVKGSFDFQNKIPAVALAFSGDALDVFGIDTEAVDPGFHRADFFDEQRLEKVQDVLR